MNCEKCNYCTTLKTNYERHLLSKKHLDDKPNYTCNTCGYLAKTRQGFQRHLQTNCRKEPIEYTCDTCQYKTLCKQAYQKHLETKTHVNDKSKYSCESCGYLAPTKQAYNRHNCSKEPILYNCIPCEYTTSSKQSYELHLLTQIHCKICIPIKVKEVPTPLYFLNKYHRSAIKMWLHYMGYRRLSQYSKFIVYRNQLITKDEYAKVYMELENLIKQEQGFAMKYQRYAYKNNILDTSLEYPFNM